jgi:hypothetical protein
MPIETAEHRQRRISWMTDYRKRNRSKILAQAKIYRMVPEVKERRYHRVALWHAKRVALTCTSCGKAGTPVSFPAGMAQCKRCCLVESHRQEAEWRAGWFDLVEPLLQAMRATYTMTKPTPAELPALVRPRSSVSWGARGSVSSGAAYQHEYHAANRERRRIQSRDRASRGVKVAVRRLRAEMVAAYGGACSCCGELNPAFLTLEHLNGGGAEHKKRLGTIGGRKAGPDKVLRDLRRRGWPKDEATVLCFNCNCAKYFRGDGVCPHELERFAAVILCA